MEIQTSYETQSFYVVSASGEDPNGCSPEKKKMEGRSQLYYLKYPRDCRSCPLSMCDGQICVDKLQKGAGLERVPRNMADLLTHWIPLGCADYDVNFFLFVIVAGQCGLLETRS